MIIIDIHVPPPDTNESTNISVHRTGTQIYQLQKQIEEVLTQCRTLAFFTNNIPTIEAVLEQGKIIALELREAATIPGKNCAPTFNTDDFRTNIFHRAGPKRISCYSKRISQPKRQKCNNRRYSTRSKEERQGTYTEETSTIETQASKD